jgi:hypothetical protein
MEESHVYEGAKCTQNKSNFLNLNKLEICTKKSIMSSEENYRENLRVQVKELAGKELDTPSQLGCRPS